MDARRYTWRPVEFRSGDSAGAASWAHDNAPSLGKTFAPLTERRRTHAAG